MLPRLCLRPTCGETSNKPVSLKITARLKAAFFGHFRVVNPLKHDDSCWFIGLDYGSLGGMNPEFVFGHERCFAASSHSSVSGYIRGCSSPHTPGLSKLSCVTVLTSFWTTQQWTKTEGCELLRGVISQSEYWSTVSRKVRQNILCFVSSPETSHFCSYFVWRLAVTAVILAVTAVGGLVMMKVQPFFPLQGDVELCD